MREMIVKVRLTNDDTKKGVMNLALEIMNEINDRGYAVLSVTADEREVFGSGGLNKAFLE